jgi:hypothetical protein
MASFSAPAGDAKLAPEGRAAMTNEERRLQLAQQPRTPWTKWRPYRAGFAGISDDAQRLCLTLALRNAYGDDVNPADTFLDSTPTHSYMRYLARYPQRLLDVLVEYAKAAPEDVLIRLRVQNRAPGVTSLHVRPCLWLRGSREPWLCSVFGPDGRRAIEASHPTLGDRYLYYDGDPELFYTQDVPDGAIAVADYRTRIEGRQTIEIRLRLTIDPPETCNEGTLGDEFERVLMVREMEAAQYAAAPAVSRPRRIAATVAA